MQCCFIYSGIYCIKVFNCDNRVYFTCPCTQYWSKLKHCLFVCVGVYGPVNNEVMSSRSVNSGPVPGQA